jgi:hypothetical protein
MANIKRTTCHKTDTFFCVSSFQNEQIRLHRISKKQSRNRHGVVQRVPGGLGSQISTTFGTWRWWGCQPHAPAAFTSRNVLIFTRGWVDPRAMVRSEGDISLKNSVTPLGINPGTVRLIAQSLNHYATPHRISSHQKGVKVRYRSCDISVFYSPTERPATNLHATKWCRPTNVRRHSTLQNVLFPDPTILT